jgi:hypothetical protein
MATGLSGDVVKGLPFRTTGDGRPMNWERPPNAFLAFEAGCDLLCVGRTRRPFRGRRAIERAAFRRTSEDRIRASETSGDRRTRRSAARHREIAEAFREAVARQS